MPEQKLEPVMPSREDYLIKDPAIVGAAAYGIEEDAEEKLDNPESTAEEKNHMTDLSELSIEEEVPFRPMTGQMNIEDVLKEWERLKEENEQKRKENVRQLVLRQTGQILANFDQAVKEMEAEDYPEVEEIAEISEEEPEYESALYESETEAEDISMEETEEIFEDDLPEEIIEDEDENLVEEAVIEEDTEESIENDSLLEDTISEEIVEESAKAEEPADKEVSQVTMNTTEINDLTEKIEEVTKKETDKAKAPELRKFTAEEQKLFENFAVTKKTKKQIITAIDNMSLAAYTGNIVITGDEGLGTVTTAKNLLKCFKSIEPDFSGKTAKITGEELNSKNISEVFEKLQNGALIISEANGLSEKTVFDITRLLNQENLGMVIFLIDTKINIQKLFTKQTIISDYFNLRIDLVEMDNNALVSFAKNYAHNLEYSIDELGTLALHTRIENIQGGNHVVTKDEVRDIIDEAIWKSKKAKLKNFVDILLAKRYDEQDMIVLRERDFM